MRVKPKKMKNPKARLVETCFLEGHTAAHDAIFTIQGNGTVRAIIQDGLTGCHDGIVSTAEAALRVDKLLLRRWKITPVARRTESQLIEAIKVARKAYFDKPFRKEYLPDPSANLLPLEQEALRQKERSALRLNQMTNDVRTYTGAFETNRRKH